MKLPELTLTTGGKGCDSSRNGIFMAAEWKIFIDDFHRGWIFLKHLLEDGRESRTIRSLEITKHRDHHRCVLGTFERRPADI